MTTLNCKACGNEFHYAKGFIDESRQHTFCSLDCTYQIGQTSSCVSTFNISNEMDKEKFRDVLYTCGTMQIVMQTLKKGEKIEGEDGKPRINPSQSMVMMLMSGFANVTLIKDNEPWLIELDSSAKDTIVIPPGTPHIVENVDNDNLLQFVTFYSPPVIIEK